MRVVDLFCGVGGATLGLQRAGLEVVAGVEKDAETAALYGEMTGVEAVVADVADLRPGDLPPFEAVWASPPFQPYSGRIRRGSADPRDGIGALLAFVERFMPEILIVEEVPGFRDTCEHGLLMQMLYGWGYLPQERLVNALACGVPQHRARLIIVERRGREWRPFPWPAGLTVQAAQEWGWARAVDWSAAEPRPLPRWITKRVSQVRPLTLYHPQLSGRGGRRVVGEYPAHAPAPTVTVSVTISTSVPTWPPHPAQRTRRVRGARCSTQTPTASPTAWMPVRTSPAWRATTRPRTVARPTPTATASATIRTLARTCGAATTPIPPRRAARRPCASPASRSRSFSRSSSRPERPTSRTRAPRCSTKWLRRSRSTPS